MGTSERAPGHRWLTTCELSINDHDQIISIFLFLIRNTKKLSTHFRAKFLIKKMCIGVFITFDSENRVKTGIDRDPLSHADCNKSLEIGPIENLKSST